MTDSAQLSLEALRAALVAGVAVLIARPVCRLLAPGPRRGPLLAAVLVPWFTPSLLTGYAWSGYAAAILCAPLLAAVFYPCLLVLKFTPVAVLVIHLVRPTVSAEALYCHALVQPGAARILSRFVFRLRSGAASPAVAAWLAVLLLAFPEFELASLLSVPSWAVRVFDSHAGGLPVSASLRLVAFPFTVQAVLILAAVAAAAKGRLASEDPGSGPPSRSFCSRIAALAYVALAALTVMIAPAAMVIREVVGGIGVLARSFPLAPEIGAGLAIAAMASIAAVWWARTFMRRPLLSAGFFIGLIGPLALSLSSAWLTTRTPLIVLRDTPVPLLIVLCLLALPLAFIAVRLAARPDRMSAVHLAGLLAPLPSSRALKWELALRSPFWITVLLFVWLYWDLTASSILAPVGMTPVSVRLYNLMHYGHSSALSGMLFLSVAAPIAAAGLLHVTMRFLHLAWRRS